jgi:hypothetical protein
MTVKFNNNIPQATKTIIDAANSGALEGMTLVYDRSQQIVPLDETPLQKSGIVKQEDNITALGYGTGESADYAVIQHENLQYRHAPGRQAKYLEQPFRELTPQILEKIADKIKAAT